MTTSDSLQAFPMTWPDAAPSPGMTLRDYFAAQALAALIASNDEGAGDRIEDIPTYAYQIAEAMLKAREVKNV